MNWTSGPAVSAERTKREALIEAENNRKHREDLERRAATEAQNKRIEDFRTSHPVEIVGVSEIALLEQISDWLDEFIAAVKAYRPQTPAYDNRFRSVRFSYPFEFFFSRKNSADDGPDPKIWETIPDSLAIKTGRPLRPIYESLSSASEFPVKEPSIISDLKPPPRLPEVQVPSWSIKIIEKETRGEIDFRSKFLATVFEPEIEQVEKLRYTADVWRRKIEQQLKEAKVQQEMMDLFVANKDELKLSVSTEFQACKKQFEEQAGRELQSIRNVYLAYRSESKVGIEQHFSLGLETVPLPLPPGFPWRLFYDPDDRLIQINQRVPFVSDIIVKRTDSKRPLAKRDIEHFRRRFVPAISLHIAANVAANDWHNHVNTIVVNCWSRYFEKTTGKRKDAFVSSLKTEKKAILEMNSAERTPLRLLGHCEGRSYIAPKKLCQLNLRFA